MGTRLDERYGGLTDFTPIVFKNSTASNCAYKKF